VVDGEDLGAMEHRVDGVMEILMVMEDMEDMVTLMEDMAGMEEGGALDMVMGQVERCGDPHEEHHEAGGEVADRTKSSVQNCVNVFVYLLYCYKSWVRHLTRPN